MRTLDRWMREFAGQRGIEIVETDGLPDWLPCVLLLTNPLKIILSSKLSDAEQEETINKTINLLKEYGIV